MKVYLDLLFLLNFAFDFILLLGVSILLRRNSKISKLLWGALFGGLSIFILFINVTSLELFIIKVMISIIMILISFGYQDIKYTLANLFYLYTSSIILGGFLYYLNIEFSYKQEGLIFYHHGLSINVIVLIIFSPIIIYTYVRQGKKLKNEYANYYKIDLYFNEKIIKVTAFLDTGNKIKDPYSNKEVIIVNKKVLSKIKLPEKYLLIPYYTLNNYNLLKCYKIDKVFIHNIGFKNNILVGIMKDEIKIDGVNCIINNHILEGK
ncbi:MAG: sigma-E processing peptidase SpoIIGA [Bacilli bacterium]|nr:sigma-E processing peptidase SpoIIGA [Bacilli bacterium]